MSDRFKYLCIALGGILIAIGWSVLSLEDVQDRAVQDLGGLFASRMLADEGISVRPDLGGIPEGPLRDLVPEHLRGESGAAAGPPEREAMWKLLLNIVATSYGAAVGCLILGAGLCGFAIPFGPLRAKNSGSTVLLKRPHLIMFSLAAIYLIAGYSLGVVSGSHAGFPRSAAILTFCGLVTWLIRGSRGMGMIGYAAGFLLTPLIGLNFVRLAFKRPEAVMDIQPAQMLILVAAAASFVLFVFIWRAMPGGLEKRRFALQVRRLTAASGVATIFAGLCMLKSSVLPQQAMADLYDPAESALLADPTIRAMLADSRVQALLNDDRAKEKLGEMGFSEELIDFGISQAKAMQRDAEPPEVVPEVGAEVVIEAGLDAAASVTPETLAEVILIAGESLDGDVDAPEAVLEEVISVAMTTGIIGDDAEEAPDPTELINSLSNADIQRLLGTAGITADVNDPRVQEKINEYRNQIDPNDPRVKQLLGQIAGNGGGGGDTSLQELAKSVGASSANPGGRTTTSRSTGYASESGMPKKVRGMSSVVSGKAGSGRVSTATKEGRGSHAHPTPPPVMVVADKVLNPVAVESAEEDVPVYEEIKVVEAEELSVEEEGQMVGPPILLANALPMEAEAEETDAEASAASAEPESIEIAVGAAVEASIEDEVEDGGATVIPMAAAIEPSEAIEEVAAAAPLQAPPPPEVQSPLSRIERTVRNATHKAEGIAFLAVSIGSAMFLASIFIRRKPEVAGKEAKPGVTA